MGWIEAVRGRLVALDTAPVIYYIEKDPLYINMLHPFFQSVERGECSLVTSVVTLLEALVVPIRRGNVDLVQQFRDFLLDSGGITTMELLPPIAEEAARLRAFYTIRTPDSIQMATATFARATFFLTNDIRLPSLPNLTTLVLDKLKQES